MGELNNLYNLKIGDKVCIPHDLRGPSYGVIRYFQGKNNMEAVITNLVKSSTEKLYCNKNKLIPVKETIIRKGKWIDGEPKCPICGKDKFDGLDADIWADWKPKYCPNCGANMEE